MECKLSKSLSLMLLVRYSLADSFFFLVYFTSLSPTPPRNYNSDVLASISSHILDQSYTQTISVLPVQLTMSEHTHQHPTSLHPHCNHLFSLWYIVWWHCNSTEIKLHHATYPLIDSFCTVNISVTV